MSLELTELIATEKIQRAALAILYDELNDLIDAQQAGWTADDTAYYATIGQAAPGFTVEHIAAENFYPGTIPSLINAEVSKYPNLSSFSWRAVPKGTSDDTGEGYAVTLMIEVMVKSKLSEAETNTRIQRTLDCCHTILVENRTLNGIVTPIQAPIKSIGDVFSRREFTGSGDIFFWQGGYLQYTIDKYVNFIV